MTDLELVPYTSAPPRAFVAEWLLDPAEIAQRIGGTDFVPTGLRNNPAAITAALLYGAEVGLGPMQALAKIAVINGRPTLAAEAQRALILFAGHDLWVEESTSAKCTVAGRRKDSEAVSRVTWTMEDARRAQLAGKPPWKMYPRQMLLARASAELARAIFPDAIGGLAATEELEDAPPPLNGGVATAEVEGAKLPATRTRRRRSATTSGDEPTPAPAEPAPEPEPQPEPPAPEGPPPHRGEPDPAPEPAPEPPEGDGAEMMNGPQSRKIHALFREAGIADRDERLKWCGRVIGRELPTSKELTYAEASAVIDALVKFDPDDPQTHPFPEGF